MMCIPTKFNCMTNPEKRSSIMFSSEVENKTLDNSLNESKPPSFVASQIKKRISASDRRSASSKSKAIKRSSSPKARFSIDKDMKPKRALSAYNIFFKLTRTRIIADTVNNNEAATKEETIQAIEEILKTSRVRKPPNSRKNRNTHYKITFKELAKQISERWKSIDPQMKEIYDHYAKIDSERYKSDMKQWKLEKVSSVDSINRNDLSCDDSSASEYSIPNSTNVASVSKELFEPINFHSDHIDRMISVTPNTHRISSLSSSGHHFDNQFLSSIQETSVPAQQERFSVPNLIRSNSGGLDIDKYQHFNRGQQLLRLDKSLSLPNINDGTYRSSNHNYVWEQQHFDDFSSAPRNSDDATGGIMPKNLAGAFADVTTANTDTDTTAHALMNLCIGDDDHVLNNEDLDGDDETYGTSPQDEFWNEGCRNLH